MGIGIGIENGGRRCACLRAKDFLRSAVCVDSQIAAAKSNKSNISALCCLALAEGE